MFAVAHLTIAVAGSHLVPDFFVLRGYLLHPLGKFLKVINYDLVKQLSELFHLLTDSDFGYQDRHVRVQRGEKVFSVHDIPAH